MRGKKIKVALSLNVEALGLLNRLVTERKRGEFVSGLIVAYAARRFGETQPNRETSARLRESQPNDSVESLADKAQQGAAQPKAGGQVKPAEIAERLRELAALVGGLRAM